MRLENVMRLVHYTVVSCWLLLLMLTCVIISKVSGQPGKKMVPLILRVVIHVHGYPSRSRTFFLSVDATNQVSPLVLAFSGGQLHIMSFFPEVLEKKSGETVLENPWKSNLRSWSWKYMKVNVSVRCRYLLEHGSWKGSKLGKLLQMVQVAVSNHFFGGQQSRVDWGCEGYRDSWNQRKTMRDWVQKLALIWHLRWRYKFPWILHFTGCRPGLWNMKSFIAP